MHRQVMISKDIKTIAPRLYEDGGAANPTSCMSSRKLNIPKRAYNEKQRFRPVNFSARPWHHSGMHSPARHSTAALGHALLAAALALFRALIALIVFSFTLVQLSQMIVPVSLVLRREAASPACALILRTLVVLEERGRADSAIAIIDRVAASFERASIVDERAIIE